MYKLLKKVAATGIVDFLGDLLVVQQSDGLLKNKLENWKCKIYTPDFNLVWETKEEGVWYIIILENLLIYTYNNGSVTIGRNLDDLNVVRFKLDFPISINRDCIYRNTAFGNSKYMGLFKMDAHATDLFKLFEGKGSGMLKLVNEKYVIRFGENNSELIVSDWDINTLWQVDIAETGRYKHWLNEKDMEGRFKDFFFYGNQKLIAVAQSSNTFCFDLATGNEFWRNPGDSSWRAVVGNIAYSITNRSLWKVNLDTGEQSGYGWPHNALPSFQFKGQTIDPVVHELIFHDGLLWTMAYNGGASFVLAINPHDGHYEWIHLVETKDQLMTIQFHENRMYLSDTGSVLYVYNKE